MATVSPAKVLGRAISVVWRRDCAADFVHLDAGSGLWRGVAGGAARRMTLRRSGRPVRGSASGRAYLQGACQHAGRCWRAT